MVSLENNPLALKGQQFINAIKEYNATGTLPGNFMENVLDRLHIRDGYMLDVLEYGNRMGGRSRFYAHKVETKGIYKGDFERGSIYNKNILASFFSGKPREDYFVPEYSDDMVIDGELSNMAEKRIPDIQEYLSFSFTEEAIWQLFLVDIGDTVLRLFWHGGYNKRTFFFDKRSFINFEHKEVAPFADSEDVIPKVEINGDNTAVVKCCFWNDWMGLCIEDVVAEYSDGKVSFDRDKSRLTTLVPYDCKIRF